MVPESIKHKIIRIIVIYLSIATVLSFNFVTAAAEPKRIVLLPFKINAEKDMTYMQNGIFDMLSSRLAQEGEVVVISRQEAESAFKAAGSPDPVNESVARAIGSSLYADYTLFGSVTVFGKSISIDAKMVDVTAKTPTAGFFEQSEDLGGLITKLNQIATKINTSVLGRQTEVAQKAAPAATAAPASKPAPADERHAHPEKLIKGGGAEGEGSPFFRKEEEEDTAFQRFWRSASFKHVINGIALGDVDGDGKIETVVATAHSVIIYRSEGGRFYKALEEFKEGGTRINIGVDVADINENGYDEIFVTCLNGPRTSLSSYVLEYSGKRLSKIIDNSRWYYRVADIPKRGKILLGQRHKRTDPFSGKIYDMIWQNSEYVPEIDITTARETNLLGFTIGDILHDQQDTGVGFRKNDHIQVIDSSGKMIWRSGERYGGSTLFSIGDREDRGGAVINPQYYPMRLLAVDTDGDDETEVIAVKNYEMARSKLEKFRVFTNAHIESLSWDGLGLATKWKTRKISGFIRDYAVGDFDNDGRMELVSAVIQNEGRVLLIDPKSVIIAYEFPS
ncbi:MAG: FG-GAP-like repeat-containing protein [Desulfobacterales bacterium]|jgi:TolB-like protein